ncbi:ANK1 [Symbiodinium pilosum]|uniref:peptidylprolyl isomerase n=1 Tax=Symbiodinium pilosum TaxID=2952 RepID=A0A812JV10_SYMPI|nr:ANK1 [Symbiodinium pilosum]
MAQLHEVSLHASNFRRRPRPLLAIVCAALALAAQPDWVAPGPRSIPRRVAQGDVHWTSQLEVKEGKESHESRPVLARRSWSLLAVGAAWCAGLASAQALVKGSPPPKGYGLGKGIKEAADCRSMTECEELGRQREEEKYGTKMEKTYKVTASGARYKDMKPGNEADGVAKAGDDLKLRYRVMRAGKRSYDGVSGEATTLFSLGYGEDDGPKDATLKAPLGQGKFVKAIEEGLVGMSVGGIRRVQVRPDFGLGWKKPGKCAEAIGAVGAIAGLPAAGAEKESSCLDTSLLPQPEDWNAKRRFERRFDESLIVEVEPAPLDQQQLSFYGCRGFQGLGDDKVAYLMFQNDPFLVLVFQDHAERGMPRLLPRVEGSALQVDRLVSMSVESLTLPGGTGALHFAALHGHTDTIRSLIIGRADVNAQDSLGWAPLHLAAGAGRVDAMNLLVNSRAIPDLRSADGYPAAISEKLRDCTLPTCTCQNEHSLQSC